MTLFYADDIVTLHHGDCLDVLRELPDNSVDAVVCDPPYGLANTSGEQVAETLTRWLSGDREYIPAGAGFMGKSWDAFVPPVAVWDECLRVLKPGGHLLAFAGSRTLDLMALGVRLAGFEIRDSIAWLYGSGFPKSLDVSKAIDASAGAEREVVGPGRFSGRGRRTDNAVYGEATPSDREVETRPATDAARKWEGWGTALKPAFEPIVVARKPLTGTVAGNVLAYGTGALNIDASRIGETVETWPKSRSFTPGISSGYTDGVEKGPTQSTGDAPAGRWPTNVVLDESQAAELDRQSGISRSSSAAGVKRLGRSGGIMGEPGAVRDGRPEGHDDAGGASRFFPTFRYEAKAPTSERPKAGEVEHPTVKPLDLMRWLVRLVTPPGGVILEPFAGSGTTVEAAVLEGFQCIAIEREADYLPLIEQRLSKPMQQSLFGDWEDTA